MDSSFLVACRQREIAEAEAALKAVKRFVNALLKGMIWKLRWKKAVQFCSIGSSGSSFWMLAAVEPGHAEDISRKTRGGSGKCLAVF